MATKAPSAADSIAHQDSAGMAGAALGVFDLGDLLPAPEEPHMFVRVAAKGIQPSGPVVYTGITTDVTCRYRAGLPIEIRRQGTFRVFVNGRFVLGWNTIDQAVECAKRFGNRENN